jgi:probable HAF family extracellular repeat protein
MHIVCLTALALLFLAMARPALASATYTITDLGANTFPYAINDSGTVVGYVTYPAARNSASYNRAFVRINGIHNEIGTLGGKSSEARAVNNSNQVVGHSLNAAGNRRAFLWDSTGMKDLNGVKGPNGQSATTLGWTLSAAYGINSSGQVVGYGSHPLQDATTNNTFLWQRDANGNVSVTAVNLRIAQFETRGINDNGLVAGAVEYRTANDDGTQTSSVQASVWNQGVITELGFLSPDSQIVVMSHAYDINNSSQVVGFSTVSSGYFKAFFCSPGGVMQDLGTLGDPSRVGLESNAYNINDVGQVVGWADRNSSYDNDPQYRRAYVWNSSAGMMDLNMLTNVGTSWYLHQARDINSSGRIVGIGSVKLKRGAQDRGFLLTPQ